MSKFEGIKVVIFKGDNYDEWYRSLVNHLKAKQLYSTLTNPDKVPTEKPDESYLAWQTDEYTIQGKIGERVADEFQEGLDGINTSKGMIEYIKAIGLQGAEAQMTRSRKAFQTAQMHEEDSLHEHIATLEKCRRILSTSDAKVGEGELVLRLMDSLPPSWEPFLSATRAQRGILSNYAILKPHLITEYEHKVAMRKKEASESGSHKTALNTRQDNEPHSSPCFCKNCHKPGHLANDCWSKGGGKAGQGPRQKRYANHTAKTKPKNHKGVVLNMRKDDDAGQSYKRSWILDSGATDHITPRTSLIQDYTKAEGTMSGADGSKMPISGTGSIMIAGTEITEAYHVPTAQHNLLSVGKLTDKGAVITFAKSTGTVSYRDTVLFTAHKTTEGLYSVKLSSSDKADKDHKTLSITKPQELSYEDWHHIMGHLHPKGLTQLATQAEGIILTGTQDFDCDICLSCKQSRTPLTGHSTEHVKPGAYLYIDLVFPCQVPILTITDKGSACTLTSILGAKSEALEQIKDNIAFLETQYQAKVTKIISDNGGEFVNKAMQAYTSEKGIKHVTTSPYTPQQNGIAERKNRTLGEMARAMALDSDLDKHMSKKQITIESWKHATYIRNRCPSSAINGEIPITKLTGQKVNLSRLKPFGSKCYILKSPTKQDKMDPKACEGRLLSFTDKGYRVYNLETQKIQETAHVTFLKHKPQDKSKSDKVTPTDESDSDDEPDKKPTSTPTTRIAPPTRDEPPMSEESEEDQSESSHYSETEDIPTKAVRFMHSSDINPANIIHTKRGRVNMATKSNPCPPTLVTALKSPEKAQWEKAIMNELESLEKLNTWSNWNFELPPGKKAISTKWVFARKDDGKGNTIRHKARLVARGFSQIYGTDYEETYATAVRLNTIRIMLALSLHYDWDITQSDVVTAFLYAKLDVDIFITMPEGYELLNKPPQKYLKLEKGLYGLKQAQRLFGDDLAKNMKEHGYLQSNFDRGLFYKQQQGLSTKEGLHVMTSSVDDLLSCTRNSGMRTSLSSHLATKYEMKEMGRIQHILGSIVNIDTSKGKITIHQKQSLKELGKDFKQENASRQSVPMAPGLKLEPTETPQEMQNYRSGLGRLGYPTQFYRPDMAFAVSKLGRYSNRCNEDHWRALQKTIRYAYQTQDLALVYSKSTGDIILDAYVDASYNSEESHSVSGYVIRLNKNPIAWRSGKQKTIALSSTEAEIVALVDAIKEILWVRGLLEELGINLGPTTIYEDNQATIAIANNQKANDRTRHIMHKTAFIREHVEAGNIKLIYCETADMLADYLTKGIGPKKFQESTVMLGLEVTEDGGLLDLSSATYSASRETITDPGKLYCAIRKQEAKGSAAGTRKEENILTDNYQKLNQSKQLLNTNHQ